MENMIINHWAVFACALFNLALGALWYSPFMFAHSWARENNLTDEDIRTRSNPPKQISIAFILAYLMSYNLAFFLSDAATDWKWGMTAGFLAGFGWAALTIAMIAVFEMKSLKYVLINGGFIIIYFTIIGLILGAWR